MRKKPSNTLSLVVVGFGLLLLLIWTLIIARDALDPPPTRWSEDGTQGQNKTQSNDQKGILTELQTIDKASYEQSTAENKPNELERRQIIRRTDLAAQRGMWRATNSLVYLTVFQVFIGFVGVWLIYSTLHETKEVLREASRTTKAAKKATRESKKANILQLKPYLSLVSTQMDPPFERGEDGKKIGFFFEFKNTGKSTAEILDGCIQKGNFSVHIYGEGSKVPFKVSDIQGFESGHFYLNPDECFKISCVATISDLEEFIPIQKLAFDIYGNIQFRDISTPSDEIYVRLSIFHAVRTVANFSNVAKEWGDVELVYENSIIGDRVVNKNTGELYKHQ